jgi:hypothetical protein
MGNILTDIDIMTCMALHATNMTGSNSGDWIYWHLVTRSHLITLTYSITVLLLIYTIYITPFHTP